MKKIISIIFLLNLFLLLIPFNIVNGENDEWNVFKTASGDLLYFECKNEDIISFEKKTGVNQYRVVLNGDKVLPIDFKNGKLSFIRFYEMEPYYYIYGSYYNDYDLDSNLTTPYILRINHDFDEIIYYYDEREEINEYAHFYNILAYGNEYLILGEKYKGEAYLDSVSEYQICKFDKDLNLLKTFLCGEYEMSLEIVYDVLEIGGFRKRYFDIDFNLLEGYKREETYIGHFELYDDCYIDDIFYEKGKIVSEPGIYVLDDKKHDKKVVTVEPIIEIKGTKLDDYYIDYVEYKVSGGKVTVNNEASYLNGIISKPGKYKIIVDGRNGYQKEYELIIYPKLLSDIESGDTLDIGSRIEFDGSAKLNETIISSGYIIKEPGNYTLSLLIDENTVAYQVSFTVLSEVVSKENKLWVLISLISIAAIILAVLIIIVIKEAKKHKVK